MISKHVPNYNTFADLIDRLIVCVNKLAAFENMKRVAQGELDNLILLSDCDSRDRSQKLAMTVAHWDNASRNECEIRNLLKRAIDEKLAELITNEEYRVLPDFRTFRQSEKTVADILAEQCEEIGQSTRERIAKEYTR